MALELFGLDLAERIDHSIHEQLLLIKMRVSTCRLYTALEPQSGASTGLLAHGEPIEHHQIGPHTDYHRPVLHQSGTNP